MLFFTSDIHFGDPTTMQCDSRPFKSIKEYDKFMIKTLNKTLSKNDTLYIIGDLFDCDNKDSFVWKKSAEAIKKLKINIILIMGNNEYRVMEYFFNNDFQLFKSYCQSLGIIDVKKDDYVSFSEHTFYLTHKPVDHKKEFINLFGHLHRSKGIWQTFGINVACDLNHFRPYSENDILFQLEEKNRYWPNDKNLQLL